MDANERRKVVFEKYLHNPPTVNPEKLYRPRDTDIIIVGPPKSGTTWLQQILHQIRTKGDEDFNEIYEETWFIPNPKSPLDFNLNAEQKWNPRIFKHHEAYGIVETTKNQKHVVVVRDPHDAAYSWTKFINGFYGSDEDISDEDMAEALTQLHEANSATNFACISSWWQHRNDANVMFFFYEDVRNDLKNSIAKIADFINIALTDEELNRVTYLCSFEYMAKNSEKFSGANLVELFMAGFNLEKWTPKVGMVRVEGGKVGQGKNIGPKLKAVVDKLWSETIERDLGFKSYQDMRNES